MSLAVTTHRLDVSAELVVTEQDDVTHFALVITYGPNGRKKTKRMNLDATGYVAASSEGESAVAMFEQEYEATEKEGPDETA